MKFSFAATLCLLSLATWILPSCEQETYEAGEGDLSLFAADFVEAKVDAGKVCREVVTDRGETWQFEKGVNMSWATKGDSAYRAILYYDSTPEGPQPISLASVMTARIMLPDELEAPAKTDPIKVESLWMANTKRFLNLTMYLYIGQTDSDDATHMVGVVAETIRTADDGRQTICLKLLHDQGNVPEYYSQRTFLSIPTADLPADSVEISVQTYDGIKTKTFSLH